jgi:hypothetical protein
MDQDRAIIDPHGKYGSEGLTRVEANARGLMQLLAVTRMERTRDVFDLHVGGDEDGAVVIVTAEAVELRLPTVEWTCGAYGPALTSRFWKRVKWSDAAPEQISEMTQKALAKRRAEFKPCRFCGREFPPEHRHGNVCHGCAEKHLHVVH